MAPKTQLRPFLTRDTDQTIQYQFTEVFDKKVLHRNLSCEDAVQQIANLLQERYHQCVLYTQQADYHITYFSRSKIRRLPSTKADQPMLTHDKPKAYAIPDGTPCDFLIRLGVMTPQGTVVKSKYNKFRQLNKYLELVSECVAALPADRRLRIVDFGCGKSYLTFALYHYLVHVLGRSVEMTGLDLKEDVIALCSRTAQELGYTDLHFQRGDIAGFDAAGDVDMVVTLHACDTATDEAIVQALSWNAKIVLLVPCCQHELLGQVANPDMKLLLKHGVIKERLSSLITDSIRGQLLQSCGYDVQIMEFISMEHTPKNILIKALRKGGYDSKAYADYRRFASLWRLSPYLEARLRQTGRLSEEK